MSLTPSSGASGPTARRSGAPAFVCPACRGWRDGMWHQAGLADSGDALVCTACERRFELIDVGSQRIPMFVAGVEAARIDEAIGSFEVATWAGNHWGMFAQPSLVDGQLGWLEGLLASLDDLPDGPILVLGSATCGVLTALPATTANDRAIVCLDAHPGHLGLAAELAAGRETLPYARAPGRIASCPVTLGDDVKSRLRAATLVCANAVDPPFGPDEFALILCLNLVDSVPRPTLLLSQCEALVKPTGAVVVASPYNWREDITADDERLDTILAKRDDLPLAIESLATGAIDPEFMPTMRLQWRDREVRWELRAHDRMTVRFSQHAMLLRKAD